jgi:hypothetical protein
MSTLSYEEFLSDIPDDRRLEIEKVWQTVRDNIPNGYNEEIDEKFLSFRAGNDWYVALANQKNYISLYLIPTYVYPELKAKLDNGGKKLKSGKSCINFKTADELPLNVIAEIISATDMESYKAEIMKVRNTAKSKK